MTTIDRPPARSRASRFWEGAHSWGFYEETSALYAARTGVHARRLVVYPPGTSAGERRALAFRRRWPSVGGLLALLAALAAAPASSVTALAAMTAVYAGGFVVSVIVSRGVWRDCRHLRCSTVRLGDVCGDSGDVAGVELCHASLLALERARAAGRIDEVGFELGWGRIYREVEARSRALG